MSQRFWSFLGITLAVLILLGLLTRALFFSFVENYELGYKFDKVTGETTMLVNTDKTPMRGYIYQRPFVDAVHTIDLRPMQVCISANSRVLNCMLVEFNPKGFEQFMQLHGRDDYDQIRLKDILMSYAYDDNSENYVFLNIVKDQRNEQTFKTTPVVTNDTIAKK